MPLKWLTVGGHTGMVCILTIHALIVSTAKELLQANYIQNVTSKKIILTLRYPGGQLFEENVCILYLGCTDGKNSSKLLL